MGRDAEGREPREASSSDRRRSADVNQHVGLIVSLVTRWRRSGHLTRFDRDEVVSIAFLEAERLLRQKYNPERATVSTFLSKWLFGRTVYRILVESGQRKRVGGWIRPEREWCHLESTGRSDPPSREADSEQDLDLADLIRHLHPDIRSVAQRLSEGMTIRAIIDEDTRTPLFDTRDMGEDPDQAEQELLAILRSEVRRATE